MAQEIKFKGKTEEEVKQLSLNDFSKLIPARARRTIKRGFSEEQKRLLAKIEKFKMGLTKKPIKTHCRDMIILPQMLGLQINVYNGKVFNPILIQTEMLGRYLGEFSLTRSKITHSAPGVGATKSSGGKAKK